METEVVSLRLPQGMVERLRVLGGAVHPEPGRLAHDDRHPRLPANM